MYYTVIKDSGHLRTLDKCRKHSPAARAFYISLVFSNDHRVLSQFIIWPAPRAGTMNQIARCDWLPERARWRHLARSGLSPVSRKQNFTKSHKINPLLTNFVRLRWLDIGLVLFWGNLWTSTSSRSINTQHLVNNPYIIHGLGFFIC